ncbi:MAG: carboxymuconolactone decarboxylase family protein [Planctomycetota bacterium]|nr:MAG: carboxymuconolactone decarboxylase family protein [Planctomycetota bacterium]
MSRFPLHTAETAPDAAALIASAKKEFGFLPNLLATMAEAPALLEGYMTLAAIFDKSDLSPTERQIILMVNNRLNGCTYCMSAHTGIARAQGVPDDVIDALRDGSELADPKLEALRVFAVRINESRGWPEREDIAAVLSAGYTNRTVLEVILGTALKVMSNYTNHIASTPLDAAFSAVEWTPAELADSVR